MALRMKVFTLPFSVTTGAFDDEVVVNFLADKQLVEVRDYFYVQGELPYLSLLVIYRTDSSEFLTKDATKLDKDENTVKNQIKALSESERNLYESLRAWRNDRAAKDGKPVFLIARNTLLLRLVLERPTSLNKLREINGFGEVKVKQYGPDILALLSSTRNNS